MSEEACFGGPSYAKVLLKDGLAACQGQWPLWEASVLRIEQWGGVRNGKRR
jgi:hypothetical protein